MIRSEKLADYLEIWGFERDLVVFRDGSLGFAFKTTPKPTEHYSDEGLDQVASHIKDFLNHLPENIDFQIVQDVSEMSEEKLSKHLELKSPEADEISKKLCDERVGRLKIISEQNTLPEITYRIFFRKPLTQSLVDKPKFLSKTQDFPEISETRFNKEVLLASKFRDEVIISLENIGARVTPLSSNEISELIYRQWNPERLAMLNELDPEDVRPTLLFTDVEIDKKSFHLSNRLHRVLSLKILPDQTYSSMAKAVQNLPFGSRLYLSIHIPDQKSELEKLQTQRRIAYSMAVGKKEGVSDIESTTKFQDLEGLVEEIISSGERVFYFSLNILITGYSEDELDEKVSHALRVLNEMGGAEGMEETLASFDIFTQMAIPNTRCKERRLRIKSSNLCDLVPFFVPWLGHGLPRVLFRNRQNGVFTFDPFDESLVNSNQLISGGSGSGKSVLANLIKMQLLKERTRIFTIDIGGSDKRLCENLSGQYVPLGVDKNLGINPFDIPVGETTPSNHKLKFLVGLVELMTKESGDKRLPKLIQAEIEQSINRIYEKHQKPKLSHLKEELLSHQDHEIKKYGRILAPWCGETPYGRFIDRDTNIELQNRLITFDLKKLESYPDLQAICLCIVTDLIWSEVQKDRGTKKLIIFDECWKLLKDAAGVVFIEEVFRTCRKYFCSAIAISQHLSDFANSEIAGAILPNCAIKWVLMQPPGDFSHLKETLDLNDNEIEMIKSLRSKKGQFSEAYMMSGGEDRAVVMIETTPLEYWLLTTHPADISLLEKKMKENPESTPFEVLTALAEEYPKGA